MKNKPETSNIFRSKYPQAFEGEVLEAQYFFFEAETADDSKLDIVFGGYEKCAPSFKIERTTYPYYVIECATKGLCSLTLNDTTYPLKRGTLAGFSPGTPHLYRCDKDDPLEHLFVAFTGTQAAELMKISTLAARGTLELTDTEDAIQLMEAILRNGIRKTEYSKELCCGYLRSLLLEQACSAVLSGQEHSQAEATYRRCRKFIDENFSNVFFISEIAQACRIDIRYMSSLFKQYSHITPHQYLMRLKMNKAVILMLTSNLPIGHAAKAVGFDDPYHFSRNFKKVHGISPQKYREFHLHTIKE
jgi:AraC-like DNA-binding protein